MKRKKLLKYLPDNAVKTKYEKYFITKCGKVFREFKTGYYERSISLRKDGYYQIKLTVNGKNVMMLLHRLLMETFYPNKDSIYLEINHKNMNRSDYSLDNLEWVNRSENMKHRSKNTILFNRGEKNPRAILKKEDVLTIRSSSLSNSDIAKLYKVSWSCVVGIRKRRIWTHI